MKSLKKFQNKYFRKKEKNFHLKDIKFKVIKPNQVILDKVLKDERIKEALSTFISIAGNILLMPGTQKVVFLEKYLILPMKKIETF